MKQKKIKNKPIPVGDGPGIYDALATRVREQTGAEAVLLLIVGGNKGSGMSVQGRLDKLWLLAPALHQAADNMGQQFPR